MSAPTGQIPATPIPFRLTPLGAKAVPAHRGKRLRPETEARAAGMRAGRTVRVAK